MGALYDTIGIGYADLRQPDPSIEQAIHTALGDAETVVNVGAGSGSYEPSEKSVLAVELSPTMIRQRPLDSAPVVQASAMALPFESNTFDASLSILTVHHWPDKAQGISELRRVARCRAVILTWDPSFPGFWLTEYIPEVLEIDRPIFPMLHEYERLLGSIDVVEIPIPHNCTDGFMCAYWRRPEAYLDSNVRAAISTFSKLGDVSAALGRLERDLESGEWHRRYGDILSHPELDLGYRLIVATL
jgi:SAM-dependent methyltransferase